MINHKEAKLKAEIWITSQPWGKSGVVVILEESIEKDFGWVFFYQSQNYLRSQNPSEMLAGNAPLIVNRYSGEVVVTGTAYDIDYYIDRYEEQLEGKHKVYILQLNEEVSRYKQVEFLSKIKKIYGCTTPDALKIIKKLPFVFEGKLNEVQKWQNKYELENLETKIIKASA